LYVLEAGIAHCYNAALQAWWSGVRIAVEARNVSLHHRVHASSDIHPSSYLVSTSALGVKWPLREADHSPRSIAEVNNAFIYTFTLSVCFHGVVLT